jgi:hypothetical protein
MNWHRLYGLSSYLRLPLWVVPIIAIPFELVITRLGPERKFHIGHSAKPLVTSHASGLRATNGHSGFYANPRSQARVLPARSKMVTTLIEWMSDLLTSISRSTTRTQSTCPNGSVRGISLV